MSKFLTQIAVNPAFPTIGRAASIGFGRSLNFYIIAAAGQHIRRRSMEEAAGTMSDRDLAMLKDKGLYIPENDGVDAHNELMKVTHADVRPNDEGNTRTATGALADGAEVMTADDVDDRSFAEGGKAIPEDPLERAARLKLLRDTIQEQLKQHARIERSNLGKGVFLNPYDIIPGFEQEILRQLKPRKINMTLLEANAKAKGVPLADAVRLTERSNEVQAAWMANNGQRVLQLVEGLIPVDSEGNELTAEDAEDVYLDLPPLMRARFYVAVDQSLWFLRDRVITAQLNGVPGTDSERQLIAGLREELYRDFDFLMSSKHEAIYEAVVQARSKWPTMNPQESDIDPGWAQARAEKIAKISKLYVERQSTPPTKEQLEALQAKFARQAAGIPV